MYSNEYYDNFKELNKRRENISKQLKKNLGSGSWEEENLILFPTLLDYTYYELGYGKYAKLGLFSYPYEGVPHLVEVINMELLSKLLLDRLNKEKFWTNGEVVIYIPTGIK